MNPRVATALTGVLTIILGLAGLFSPLRVLAFLGFMVENASRSASALGEIRATYGGIFLVLGVYTLAATFNPAAHRGRILLLGLVWLGAALGRLFGVSVDGNPGLFGWLACAFEVAMGGTLLLASAMATDDADAVAAPAPLATPDAGLSPPV